MPGDASDPEQSVVLHATTIDFNGQGVLITGESGRGKSALALHLMALGARLVADDGTRVTCSDGAYRASVPGAIAGRIEARGIGVLHAEHLETTILVLAIDMNQIETERLPPPRRFIHEFVSLPCLYRVEAPHFPVGILQYLKGGRR